MDKQISIMEYTLEDIFKLDPENRWIKKAALVPWEMAENKYSHLFRKHCRPAKDIRIALGALIIQQTLGISDEETVNQIAENPYLQHFIGLKKFTNQCPFDSSLMVWFRKRLSAKFMAEINEAICREEAAPKVEESKDQPKDDNDNNDPPHGGTLILDASCTPANITYPTDTGLLGKAIEKTEEMIDELHTPHRGEQRRPRTYRRKSRQVMLAMIKKRKPNSKDIRKCIRKQLGFLSRNLKIIDKMLENGGELSARRTKLLPTIQELHTQQTEMYQTRSHRIKDRIVSLSQPYIRPIVRGKASASVEFGAKIAISVVNGYTYLDKMSFDNFSEAKGLEESVEEYRRRFGVLPKVILADTIYRNRENRKFCKENGIRLSGRPLGRPLKNQSRALKLQERRDTSKRNEVEGKFGELKSRYGLAKIKAQLQDTSESSISVAIFVMNLNKKLRSFLLSIFEFKYFSPFPIRACFCLK